MNERPGHSTTKLGRQTMPLDAIRIGGRHRRDLGDLDALVASMDEIGLLHPVVVHPDGTLIAGQRRLRAAERLGWSDVPVTVVDVDEIVRGEVAENTHRKDLTPSELVAVAQEVERREREEARQRKAHGGRAGKLPERQIGDTRDRVAAQLGISGKTYERAKSVVDAAEAEPEKYSPLVADMDRTGRVDGVYRRLKIARQAEQIRAEPPPLPGKGPYRVIVVDPPWRYDVRDEDPSRRGVRPYPSMSIPAICELPVLSIAAPDCVLWLWTTNSHIREAFAVLDAWSFQHKSVLTWAKNRIGCGDWLRAQTEHCILAVRGKPVVTLSSQTTLLHAPVRGHSAKPVEFYNLVKSLCPAPRYADVFSRYRHNDRWDCHGDEAPPDIREIEKSHPVYPGNKPSQQP